MDALALCAGTLVVEHPDQVLLDHLDARNGYAYPAYDRLVTNGSAVLVDGDLLAPNLIGTTVDRDRFLLLRELLPRIAGVADLPPVALQDAGDEQPKPKPASSGETHQPRTDAEIGEGGSLFDL